MPSRTISPFVSLRVCIDVERIVVLTFLAVIIEVMVEKENLHISKTSLIHCRTENLHELLLILPRHYQRHRVTRIERLVLHCDRVDVESLGLHCLDPLHEVLCIIIIARRFETASCPGVVSSLVSYRNIEL